jgi:addiction module HigA family antidote
MLKSIARRAAHPGAFLRIDFLPAAKLTQAELARQLGVSRRTIVELIHERRRVSAQMAERLARVFGTTPEFWRHLQRKHDALMRQGQRVNDAVQRAVNGPEDPLGHRS